MTEWKRVRDELPANGQVVLTTKGGLAGGTGVGWFLIEDKEAWLEEGGWWMPYPERPLVEAD